MRITKRDDAASRFLNSFRGFEVLGDIGWTSCGNGDSSATRHITGVIDSTRNSNIVAFNRHFEFDRFDRNYRKHPNSQPRLPPLRFNKTCRRKANSSLLATIVEHAKTPQEWGASGWNSLAPEQSFGVQDEDGLGASAIHRKILVA